MLLLTLLRGHKYYETVPTGNPTASDEKTIAVGTIAGFIGCCLAGIALGGLVGGVFGILLGLVYITTFFGYKLILAPQKAVSNYLHDLALEMGESEKDVRLNSRIMERYNHDKECQSIANKALNKLSTALSKKLAADGIYQVEAEILVREAFIKIINYKKMTEYEQGGILKNLEDDISKVLDENGWNRSTLEGTLAKAIKEANAVTFHLDDIEKNQEPLENPIDNAIQPLISEQETTKWVDNYRPNTLISGIER